MHHKLALTTTELERATSWTVMLGLSAVLVTVSALTGGLLSPALNLAPLLVVAASFALGFPGSVLVGSVSLGAVIVFVANAALDPSAPLFDLAIRGSTHAAVIISLALLSAVAERGR